MKVLVSGAGQSGFRTVRRIAWRRWLGKETSAIFEAPTSKDARARLDVLKAGLGKQVVEAMERLHGEVKRAKPMFLAYLDQTEASGMFEYQEACLGLVSEFS